MKSQYLVAIPVFNEEAYVQRVLAATRAFATDILVVDDGSTDQTPRLLREMASLHLIRHRSNLGYGQSLIDAFAFARDRGYTWLISMDCDEQHEPAAIPEFLEAIAQDDADVISGSRYLQVMSGNDSPPSDRQSINRRITAMLNERLGLSLTDAFCGFKAYRVAALSGLRITEPGYAMPMQFWAQAARFGLRVRELPIKLVYNDPDRHFGGALDDPDIRYRHYMEVFDRAVCEAPAASPHRAVARRGAEAEVETCACKSSGAFARCMSS